MRVPVFVAIVCAVMFVLEQIEQWHEPMWQIHKIAALVGLLAVVWALVALWRGRGRGRAD